MAHLRSFRAPRYRGLGGLSLEGLRRVNLLTGPNDTGKTSTLEAIWLFHGRYAPENLWDQRVQRSDPPPVNPLSALDSERIEMRGSEDGEESSSSFEACFQPVRASGADGRGGGGRSPNGGAPAGFPGDAIPAHLRPARIDGSLRWWLDGREVTGPPYPYYPVPGAANAVAIPSAAENGNGRAAAAIEIPSPARQSFAEPVRLFSEVVKGGGRPELRDRLRAVLPVVSDLELVTDADDRAFLMTTTEDGERLPLNSLGHGFVRLLRIFLGFHAAAGGLVLLDEVDGGLHHRALPAFWRAVRRMATEFDAQVFAVTHSMECIRAAIDAFDRDESSLAVHGLYRPSDGNGSRAVTYVDETLQAAIETNMEFR